MSLPNSFKEPSIYFRDCLNFLEEYKWIFHSSNTKYLKKNTLESFPNEWKEYFQQIEIEELNRFPDDLKNKANLPETLREFLEKLQELTPSHSTPCVTFERKPMKGMSPKKTHEILELSKFVSKITSDTVNLLIDFGSGLGYLSELLYKTKHFLILGLESDVKRVEMARKRQKDNYPESESKVVFEPMKITLESGEQIKALITKYFPDLSQGSHAIIGLHACGDLSITAIDLFLQMETIKNLIIMPCCYHKLELSEMPDDDRIFKNFPLSQALLEALKDKNGRTLNRPFLRLACQQTVSSWRAMTTQHHESHAREMFIRAVAECLAEKGQIVLKRKGRSPSQCQTIYERMINQYNLRSLEGNHFFDWTIEHKLKVDEILNKYPNGPKSSEGLTCLQTALQSLCENIVLYDRVCYTKEKASRLGIQLSVGVSKILKDDLSPRCIVFHAEKLQ